MEHFGQYLEKTRHGTAAFPAEYYDCCYPMGLSSLPVHWHDEFEITYIRAGRGTYLIDLEPCPVKAGDILFLPSGVLHGIPEGRAEFLESDSFVFQPEFLGSRDDLCRMKYVEPLQKGYIRFAPVLHAEETGAEIMRRELQALRVSFTKRRAGYELEAKARILMLLRLFYDHFPRQEDPAGRTEALEKIRDVVRYIRQHYPEAVSVADLAEVCHFNEYYFMRFFKRHMNMTCMEYLNGYRLEIAAGRLLSGGGSITETALDTGFRSVSYFNRVFRKKFGMTPGEYRKLGKNGHTEPEEGKHESDRS